MKKILFIICFLVTIIPAFSQELKRNKKPEQDFLNKRVFHVTKNLTFFSSGVILYTQLNFKSYKDKVNELEKKRGQGIITDDEFNVKKDALPAGGILQIETKRSSVEASDTKNLTIIIQDKSGKELQRIACESKQGRFVPENSMSAKHYVSNIDVKIPETLNGTEFDVFILDEFVKIKYEFIIKND